MRYLTILFLVITFISCEELEVTKFEYSTSTMIGRNLLSVTKDSVVVDFNGRSKSTHFSRATKDSEWIALVSSLEGVDFDKVSTLEAPSQKRATDAAPFARFSFYTKDSTYQSASFDHKNPNKVLMPLMEEILKIQEENKK